MNEDIDSFAEKVKAKHPVYKDVPNAELTQKVLEKYPTYKALFTNVVETVGRQIGGVVPNTVESPIGQQITKPIPTMQALGNKISNVIPEPEMPPTYSPGAMLQQTAHGIGQLVGGAVGATSVGDLLMMAPSMLEGALHGLLQQTVPAKRQALLALAEKDPIAAIKTGMPVKEWPRVDEWVTEMKAKAPSVQEAEVEPVLHTRAKMILDRAFGIEPKPINAPKQIGQEVAPKVESKAPQIRVNPQEEQFAQERAQQVIAAREKAPAVQMKEWQADITQPDRTILSNASGYKVEVPQGADPELFIKTLNEIEKAEGGKAIAKPITPAMEKKAFKKEMSLTPNAEPWHSKLAQVLEDPKIPKIMPGEGLINTLKNKGVKPEELQWSGLEDFVKGKNKVTKPEVEKFLKENAFRVNEIDNADINPIDHPNADPERVTHYEEYQLPGGKNYREKLFQLPQKERALSEYASPWVKSDYLGVHGNRRVQDRIGGTLTGNLEEGWVYYSGEGTTIPVAPKGVDFAGAEQRLFTMQPKVVQSSPRMTEGMYDAPIFSSGHFDEPNVLAHTRYNDRKIGKDSITFLEEIQSDWHQAGREKGYGPDLPSQKVQDWFKRALPNDDIRKVSLVDLKDAGAPADVRKEFTDWIKKPSSNIPNAPFKKTWHEMVMKRMIRQAVEEGKDGIAWTTGIQQYKRYPSGGETGKIAMGMKGFYDKILPEFVNKFTKKWGGQVIEVGLPAAKGVKLPTGTRGELKDLAVQIVDGNVSMEEAHEALIDILPTPETVNADTIRPRDVLPEGLFDEWVASKDPYRRRDAISTLTKALVNNATKPGLAAGEKVHYLKFTPELKRAALKVGFPLFSAVGAIGVSKEDKK